MNIEYEEDEAKGPSKLALVDIDSSATDGSFVQQEKILHMLDMKDSPAARAPTKKSEDYNDANSLQTNSKPPAVKAGLGALYNKDKAARPQPSHPSLVVTETKGSSSFGDIDRKPSGSSMKFPKKDPVMKRPQPGRKSSDAATLQAKKFYELAQASLCKEDLGKVSKLLVQMKNYGNSKNEKEYIKAAKELISVLVDSKVDCKRIQLINTLFPLLPMKYRYKIQKMASILAFEKSGLRSQCKERLSSEQEFTTVKSFVLSMLFSHSSSHDSMSLTDDRAFLEDSQKVLTILVNHDVNMQLLFDLLPERQLRRVRTLALEMKRTRDVEQAKKRSTNYIGEKVVQSSQFKPVQPKQPSPRMDESETPDAESQRALSQALSNAMDVNRTKKERVSNFQKKTEPKSMPFNPYQRSGLQYSNKRNLQPANGNQGNVDASKRVRGGSRGATTLPQSSSMNNNNPSERMDVVDRCLQQAKTSYVQPKTRQERINEIKSNVPKGMVCTICAETPTEVCSISFTSFISTLHIA